MTLQEFETRILNIDPSINIIEVILNDQRQIILAKGFIIFNGQKYFATWNKNGVCKCHKALFLEDLSRIYSVHEKAMG